MQALTVELDRVEVDGHSIAYRSSGAGDVLVLLHGFLCDSRVWERQLEDLSDLFRVVSWDAPSAGASSDPPVPFSIGDWARCLVDFLDAVGVARAHIGGLSWGGLLAQELYRLDPARVATLVLADTYAGWRGSFGPEVAAQRLTRCERESTLDAEEFVRLWVPHEFFTDTVSVRARGDRRRGARKQHGEIGGVRRSDSPFLLGSSRGLIGRRAEPRAPPEQRVLRRRASARRGTGGLRNVWFRPLPLEVRLALAREP